MHPRTLRGPQGPGGSDRVLQSGGRGRAREGDGRDPRLAPLRRGRGLLALRPRARQGAGGEPGAAEGEAAVREGCAAGRPPRRGAQDPHLDSVGSLHDAPRRQPGRGQEGSPQGSRRDHAPAPGLLPAAAHRLRDQGVHDRSRRGRIVDVVVGESSHASARSSQQDHEGRLRLDGLLGGSREADPGRVRVRVAGGPDDARAQAREARRSGEAGAAGRARAGPRGGRLVGIRRGRGAVALAGRAGRPARSQPAVPGRRAHGPGCGPDHHRGGRPSLPGAPLRAPPRGPVRGLGRSRPRGVLPGHGSASADFALRADSGLVSGRRREAGRGDHRPAAKEPGRLRVDGEGLAQPGGAVRARQPRPCSPRWRRRSRRRSSRT